MQKELVIDVQAREQIGKNEARRLRKQGLIPGVVYGGDRPPVSITVDPRAIITVLHSESGTNTLLTLRLDKQEDRRRTVMIREVQREPARGRPIHADFVRIDMTAELTVKVPVHLTGTPIGVKTEGGLIDYVHREVEVTCLPADIPGSLEIDVSELHINQHIEAGQLPLPERVRLITDPGQVLAVIVVPRAEVEVAPAAVEGEVAAAPAEPEVIKKGKETEEAPAEKGKGEKGEKGESKGR